MKTTAILLDIEGTTSPIDFVHKVLFPYAKERVTGFVQDNFAALSAEANQLSVERASDQTFPDPVDVTSPNSVSSYLRYLVDVDRKSTPLKSIQGKIWQAGYDAGELRSQVFDDVPRAFEMWKTAGKIIAIYSSGSVLAQKNLFKYTDHGDLTPFISHYFDTNVGGKREPESYRKIAIDLRFDTAEILFVSDVAAELDAAREAGMKTALSIRKGNVPIEISSSHGEIHNLTGLEL